MKKKFIIWTMQRSGGTSLTSIIEKLGQYDQVLHEPFNGNQVYGAVIADRPKTSNDATEYFQNKFAEIERNDTFRSFKHCYEVHSLEFNMCLFGFANETGRNNIVLQRSNNFERQISLAFAKATGVWSKKQLYEKFGKNESEWKIPEIDIEKLMEHEKKCRKMEQSLFAKISDQENSVLVLYESLYDGDFDQRCKQLDKILGPLQIELSSSNAQIEAIRDTLMYQKQGGGVYEKIPNIFEAREAYEREFECKL